MKAGSGVPGFPGEPQNGILAAFAGPEAGGSLFFRSVAMERLLTMDGQEYVSRMQAECRRVMERIADAVNAAPSGNVINGSELEVRDLMAELRRKAFEVAVQMRIDSTESSFSPSGRRVGPAQGV
jgi:hypothetical protein